MLPEIRLLASDVVPPIVFPGASIKSPLSFASAVTPRAFVPTRLPAITFPAPSTTNPAPLLPEIRLPLPGMVPPIVLFVPTGVMRTPQSVLARAIVPVPSVPIWFPSTRFPGPLM